MMMTFNYSEQELFIYLSYFTNSSLPPTPTPSKRYWNPIRQYFKIINTRHTTVSTVLNKNKRHFILRF